MEAKTKDLWVYIELDENEMPGNVGIELLNPGRRIAEAQGGKLVAVIVAGNAEKAATEVGRYGVDKIIVVEGDEYKTYSADAYTAALAYLAKKHAPLAFMVGATTEGRTLAPRVSCRLQTGLTADCTEIGFDEDAGIITWTRPTFGGNIMAEIICPNHFPQMGTVRPGVFKKPEPRESRPEIVKEAFGFRKDSIGTKILEVIAGTGDKVDLEGAGIIVSGGRAVGGPGGFGVIRELAEVLGAAVGASRAAVEEGWIGGSHQIGQTGKNVAPKLYIACGISGASQHLAGMCSAETVVAINGDPNAPIHGIADYSIVGDMFEIVPEITKEITRLKTRRTI
ncbi:MAG: electron transfer flavoprotein subunit alpha/FixB family protein [Treponema sp.]|nr:electron transfer flavoprotein subunit alpha/FixB family protein [Treponema sp.]